MSNGPFDTFKTIESNRLILRQLQLTDAQTELSLSRNETVTALDNDFHNPHDSLEKAESHIKSAQASFLANEPADLAIVLKETNVMIGKFLVIYHQINPHRNICVGYHLLPQYWGHGYATEALCAVIDWLFSNTNIHRITASCIPEHHASERVMQKAGMTYEGLARDQWYSERTNRFCSYKSYAILSTDPR